MRFAGVNRERVRSRKWLWSDNRTKTRDGSEEEMARKRSLLGVQHRDARPQDDVWRKVKRDGEI